MTFIDEKTGFRFRPTPARAGQRIAKPTKMQAAKALDAALEPVRLDMLRYAHPERGGLKPDSFPRGLNLFLVQEYARRGYLYWDKVKGAYFITPGGIRWEVYLLEVANPALK